MSKSILVPLHEFQFPAACVVCLAPASSKYPVSQVFTYGRTSHTITVDVPMCEGHFSVASHKSPTEKVIGILGIVLGILAGFAGAVMLFTRWEGSGGLLLRLFIGALVGFGFFLLVWWLLAIVIAPSFAVPESKQVRSAVRITRYLRSEQVVELTFVNEQVALQMERVNGPA